MPSLITSEEIMKPPIQAEAKRGASHAEKTLSLIAELKAIDAVSLDGHNLSIAQVIALSGKTR